MNNFLEQEVFALGHNAKPANSEVSGSIGSCMAGLQQKFSSLKRAPGHDIEAISSNPL